MDKNNWYKISQRVTVTFEDRNDLNKRILDFKNLAAILKHVISGGYQNMPEAREKVLTIANNKKMSSFPRLKNYLLQAYKISLDNYNKFSEICQFVFDALYDEIKNMEKDRKDFVNKYLPQKLKGKKNGD